MCIAALKQVRSYVHLIAYLHAVLDLLVLRMLKLSSYAVKASALNMQQCYVIKFVFYSPSLVVQPTYPVSTCLNHVLCLVCRLCMVCLSQNHPVMKEDIVGVDFFHDGKINLSGKLKNELLLSFFTLAFVIDK